MGLVDQIGTSFEQVRNWIATSDEDVPFDEMTKALTSSGLAQPTTEKPRALFHDPYSIMDWGGWRQRPSALTYETLRHMCLQNTLIAGIINLRVNQLSHFARPQQSIYDKGYRVILRDRRDNQKSMTDAEQKKAAEIEKMLETTAYLLPDEKPSDRDSFRHFVRKATRDILTYDQWCFEKIPDRTGKISRFVCLPGETIRPAVADVEHMDVQQLRERVAYVQVYENTVIAEFGVDDMAWCIMNPRSDLRVNKFGFAPVEQIVRLVTAWLFGFEYNTRFFTQGSAIKGVLNIKGAIPDRQLRAFRRMWYTMVSGVQNSWRTPILNSEDIQWINMHAANREMEFSAWMDWLTKLICAVYGVDPTEVNFIFGNAGQKGGLNQARPNKDEVVESKDKGLVPLAEHVQDNLNQHVIWELAEDFEFAFTGLDAKAESKERDRRKDEVQNWKTVNEIRAEQDQEPLEHGDIILNPVYLQYVQGKEAGGGGAEDLGPGESDGSEDEYGDQFGGDDEAGWGGEDEKEDEEPESLERSQRELVTVVREMRGFTSEQLRKASRTQVLEIDIGD
jgi:phage portal protein BeeE